MCNWSPLLEWAVVINLLMSPFTHAVYRIKYSLLATAKVAHAVVYLKEIKLFYPNDLITFLNTMLIYDWSWKPVYKFLMKFQSNILADPVEKILTDEQFIIIVFFLSPILYCGYRISRFVEFSVIFSFFLLYKDLHAIKVVLFIMPCIFTAYFYTRP